MNEDFSEIIAAVKKFAVDNLSLSTLSDEELEEGINDALDDLIDAKNKLKEKGSPP